jgi:hypothetical protein
MSEDRPIYAVPTHLRQREPMAFGLTVGELAKLLVAGFLGVRIALSLELPAVIRLPGAAVVIVAGAAWALVRYRGYSLEAWLGIAFRYGVRPRRRVWRTTETRTTALEDGHQPDTDKNHGWFEVDRIRLRWTSTPQAFVGTDTGADVEEVRAAS